MEFIMDKWSGEIFLIYEDLVITNLCGKVIRLDTFLYDAVLEETCY